MDPDLTIGMVRILKPDGTTAGAGFVVSPGGLIATSSHVIEAAECVPGGTVRVTFLATGREGVALVEADWWRPAKAEDVAILRLKGTLPEGVQALLLGSSGGTSGHPFKTFGFPAAKPVEGMWGYGRIGDPTTTAGQRALQLTATTEVTIGFSGAAVLDTVTHRVVGMLTTVMTPDQYGRLSETAFIAPSETLREVCPLLQLSDFCPYRGLAAFTEADKAFFYGRERLVGSLIAHLRGSIRFLAVVGPSGSGKSSVVQAGFFPALRQGKVPGSEGWNLLSFRPGSDPFAALAACGLEVGSEGDLREAVRAFLEHQPVVDRLVLFADQFEELYALAPEIVQQRFLGDILALLESDLPVTFILALRADFFGHLLRYGPVVDWLALGQVNVPPMMDEELRAAAEKPAGDVGLRFESGLVETIVEEATAEGHVLPLVQAALTQLWRQRDEGELTHAAYRAVGRVAGAISLWAEDAYSRLSGDEQQQARSILTRLVHFGEREAYDTSRQRLLRELPSCPEEQASVHEVVRRLADARLLVTDRDPRSGEEVVEIIHDTLLREWARLRRWVTELREFYLWRQRLGGRLQEWEQKGRDEGALLRGTLLTEAEQWLTERPDDLNPEEQGYIQESVARRERERTVRRRRRWGICIGLLLVLAIPYLWLSMSYYFSASDSGIVVRAGHPGLKVLPGFDHIAVVTDYSLGDVRDPALISNEQLRGLWLRRSHGYAYWGEQLFGCLSDSEAGLAYWRMGDTEEAFARLAQGIAAGDTDSAEVLGYVGLHSGADVGPVIDALVPALQGDDELHEAALAALAVVRDAQPVAVATHLESMAVRLNTSSGAESAAVAEAVGVLGGGDEAVDSLVLTQLLSAFRTGDDEVQMVVVRALYGILSRDSALLSTVTPDIAELVPGSSSEVRTALLEILGIPSPMDPGTKDLALKVVVEALADDEEAVRLAATTVLGRLLSSNTPSPSVHLSHLQAMMEDEDSAVRSAAVQALGPFPSKVVVEEFLETLRHLVREDRDYGVRYEAVEVLAGIRDAGAIPLVVEALVAASGDASDVVRQAAVQALVGLGVDRSVEPSRFENRLWALLDDESHWVRLEAALGLLLLAEKIDGELTPALDEFVFALTSEDWQQVDQAESLAPRFAEASPLSAGIVAARLPAYIERTSSDVEAFDLVDFLRAIGENQPGAVPDVVLALCELLSLDGAVNGVEYALWKLGTQPTENLVPGLQRLLEQLDSPDAAQREAAALAVGHLSMESEDLAGMAVAGLGSKLMDPTPRVREAAALALGWIGRKQPVAVESVLDTLLDCVVSEELPVRAACAEALEEICWGESPPANMDIAPLVAALQDPSAEVRRAAAVALSGLEQGVPGSAQASIEPLWAALRTEVDAETRLAFAAVLGTVGAQRPEIVSEVLAVIDGCLTSFDGDLRIKSIWALEDLGTQQPLVASQALELLSRGVVDPDRRIRQGAVLAIRDVGMSGALSAGMALNALQPALAYPEKYTRLDAIINGIEPIVEEQPSSARIAIPLLRGFLEDPSSIDFEGSVIRSHAWEALVVTYAVVAADEPEILWPLLASASSRERDVGRQALVRVVAVHPDLIESISGELTKLRNSSQPHVRQSAAMAEEMIGIVERTEECLGSSDGGERWEEVLEWLPRVGIEAARELGLEMLREAAVAD